MTNTTPNLDIERQRRASRGVCGYDSTVFGVRICTLECKPCSRVENCPILEREVIFDVGPVSAEPNPTVANQEKARRNNIGRSFESLAQQPPTP